MHRVASLLKRWLLGTHQGAVEGDHRQAGPDEGLTSRFNRRTAKRREFLHFRLLPQAVESEPIAYRTLVARRSRVCGSLIVDARNNAANGTKAKLWAG